MSQNRILIVVAALNEEGGLRSMLPHLSGVARHVGADVVLISDGSTDGTVPVAREFVTSVIERRTQQGKLASVFQALNQSLEPSHDLVITFDGDGQHDPEAIEEILAALHAVDVVFCSRYHPESPEGRGTAPLDRQLLNKACEAMVDSVTGWKLTDPLCGLRGFRRPIIDWMLRQTYVSPDGYGLEIETVLRLWHRHHVLGQSVRFTEIPHPAIYNGDGKIASLYDDAHLEMRLQRIMDHQRHLMRTMRDLGLSSL